MTLAYGFRTTSDMIVTKAVIMAKACITVIIALIYTMGYYDIVVMHLLWYE
jgi:hypothetical protein